MGNHNRGKKVNMKGRAPVLQSRQRKVDINALDVDQLMVLSAAIGREVAKIMAEAKAKAQAVLDVYGMQLVLKYGIESKESPVTEPEKTEEPKGE